MTVLAGLATLNVLPGARLLALAFHGALEALLVERQFRVLDHVLDEVERQPVCVVQAERDVAGEHAVARGRAFEHLLEPGQPAGQHRVEAVLLAPDDLHDRLASGRSSGYASPNSRTSVSTRVWRNGSVKPSCLPWRIARRMILRST